MSGWGGPTPVISGTDGAYIASDVAVVTKGDHKGFNTGMSQGLLACRLNHDVAGKGRGTWFQVENVTDNPAGGLPRRYLRLPGDPLPTWDIEWGSDAISRVQHTRPLRLLTVPSLREAWLVGLQQAQTDGGDTTLQPRVFKVTQRAIDAHMVIEEVTIDLSAIQTSTTLYEAASTLINPHAFILEWQPGTSPTKELHWITSRADGNLVVNTVDLTAATLAWAQTNIGAATNTRTTFAGFCYREDDGTTWIEWAEQLTNGNVRWRQMNAASLGTVTAAHASYDPAGSIDPVLTINEANLSTWRSPAAFIVGRNSDYELGTPYYMDGATFDAFTITATTGAITATPALDGRYDEPGLPATTLIDAWNCVDYRLGMGLWSHDGGPYDAKIRTLAGYDRKIVMKSNSTAAGVMPVYFDRLYATDTDDVAANASIDHEGWHVLFGPETLDYDR